MNEFEIITVINRPVAKVFAAMEDFTRAPDWNPAVVEVRQEEEGPLGVGSTVVYVGRFLGRSFESSSKYIAYVPNERFATETTSEPSISRSTMPSSQSAVARGSPRSTGARAGVSSSSPSLSWCGWPRGSSRRQRRT